MKVSIIIPAYNEEKRIGNTLKEYSRYYEKLRKEKKLNYEILVSINNTTDKTVDIVKKYKKQNKNIRYLNLVKGGKGYAIIEGFKSALKRKNDLIGFVDADMATMPEAYYDLITEINNYDGVIASRYVNGAQVSPKQSIQRIIVSRMFNFVIRALLFLSYKDTQCGAKIFKSSSIEKILPRLTMSQWAFDIEILYNLKKMGYKIKEHPTTWADKEYSKINFMKAGPKMVLAVIRLRILNSPFKDLMKIYALLKREDY